MLKFVVVSFLLCSVSAFFIAGGWSDNNVENYFVVHAAREATKQLGVQFSEAYHTKLIRVIKCRSQIVAGTNLQMTVVVGLTNCRKNEVSFEEVENCEFQEGDNTYHKCDARVFLDLKEKHHVISSHCSLASKDDLGMTS